MFSAQEQLHWWEKGGLGKRKGLAGAPWLLQKYKAQCGVGGSGGLVGALLGTEAASLGALHPDWWLSQYRPGLSQPQLAVQSVDVKCILALLLYNTGNNVA